MADPLLLPSTMIQGRSNEPMNKINSGGDAWTDRILDFLVPILVGISKPLFDDWSKMFQTTRSTLSNACKEKDCKTNNW